MTAPYLDTEQIRILSAPNPSEREIAYVPPADPPSVQAALDAAFAEMAEDDRLLAAFVAELPDDALEEDLLAHKADTHGPHAPSETPSLESVAHASGGFASGGDSAATVATPQTAPPAQRDEGAGLARLFNAATGATIFFRDPVRGTRVGSIERHDGDERHYYLHHLSRDGSRFAATFFSVTDKRAPTSFEMHDTATGRLLFLGKEEKSRAGSDSVCTAGRLVSFVNVKDHKDWADRRGRVWDMAAGKLLFDLPATDLVQLSDDGRLFAATARDGTIVVWDMATGKKAHSFPALKVERWSPVQLRFSANGRHLACWGSHGLIVWDIAAVRRKLPRLPAVAADDAPRLWDDLASADPRKARLAVWRLAESPKAALPLLAKRLKPAPRPRLAPLLAALDADRAAERDAAQARLDALGEAAEGAIRQALADPATSSEARRRLKKLAARPQQPLKMTPDRLRAWRAVEALERIGTEEAMRLLKRMCAGPEAGEAWAALRRLDYARRWLKR
ncbi:MAG: hypothetical protein K2W96_17915 [Gemmataceae bacterium]|nr:hypothetical protein [Gemmataceae bacterium]